MKLILILYIAFFSVVIQAQMLVGTVTKYDGRIKILHEGTIKKNLIHKQQKIVAGDLLLSSKKSYAVITLVDKSQIVMDANSVLHFASLNSLNQKKGKIFYKITPRKAKNFLKIKTAFAIIGIKGTTFVVNAGKKSAVTLKEGLIRINSIKKEFELYRLQEKAEFHNYVSKQNAAFEKFKALKTPVKPLQTKAFDLKAGNSIVFDKNKVDETSIGKEERLNIKYFEKLLYK